MAVFTHLRSRGEDGDKEGKAEGEEGRQKPRPVRTHRCGEPEAPESAFWKKIIAYQQKLLVSPFRMNVDGIHCETVITEARQIFTGLPWVAVG